jgi:uncharacterized protein (DUF488 family)
MPFLTFGHGTASQEQITELLTGAGVELLVDVRTAPGSRRNPQVGREELQRWLPEAGIAYRWERELGGFRKPATDSPDVVWRNASFRGYAGYTRTGGFLTAVDRLLGDSKLLDQSRDAMTAVMCSETLWWRCHRRIIADFLVCARGVDVRHLMHDGSLAPHAVTPGVRLRSDGLLVYDVIATA